MRMHSNTVKIIGENNGMVYINHNYIILRVLRLNYTNMI